MNRSLKSFATFSKLFALALLVSTCGSPLGGDELTISVNATQTTLLAGQTVSVLATVTNSNGNSDVTWTLSGPGCPSNCGSLSSTTTNPTTYTAPQFLSADSSVTVTATAVADPSKFASVILILSRSLSTTCPSGNEAVLNGQYAFLLRGAGVSESLITVGSFTADGTGHITGGLEDKNGSTSGPQTGMTIAAAGSLYSVGPDNRGCLGLVDFLGRATLYRFALSGITAGVATEGRIIEFDDSTGSGVRAEGFLVQQDPSSFATDQILGSYAFGMEGVDVSGGRAVSAGVFDAATGTLSNGNLDSDDAGVLDSNVTGVAGTYTVAASGRGTLQWNLGSGSQFVLYMISSAKFIVASVDFLSPVHPILSGAFERQTASNFDNTSLSLPAVLSTVGLDAANGGSIASIGLFTPDGGGAANLILDENDAGLFTQLQTTSGTYSVSPNGRTVTLLLSSANPVVYLIGPDTAFLVGTDADATSGRLEVQTGGPFSNASLAGPYSYGTEGAGVAHRLTAVGADVFDGVLDHQATEDESTPSGLLQNLLLPTDTYSFSGSPPSGRGTLDSTGRTVAYIISPTKTVYINTPATQPRLVILSK